MGEAVKTKTCGAHPRAKGGCGQTKPLSEFPKHGGVCLKCRRAREKGQQDVAGPWVVPASGNLVATVDELVAYAQRVDPEAPKLLSVAFAGMRRCAEVLDSDRPTSAAWSTFGQLHKQALDVLTNTFGSQQVDYIDKLRALIADDDREPLTW